MRPVISGASRAGQISGESKRHAGVRPKKAPAVRDTGVGQTQTHPDTQEIKDRTQTRAPPYRRYERDAQALAWLILRQGHLCLGGFGLVGFCGDRRRGVLLRDRFA